MAQIPAPAKVFLEQEQRLSKSMLWQLLRDYYDQTGIDAWQKALVPHFVTSNSFIAHAYARVVLAFMSDCLADKIRPLDTSQPFYILELGTGSGRFSYHFLQHFLRLREAAGLDTVPFTYIMSDFTPRNIDFWKAHSRLRPLVEAGVLDFARYNMESDDAITLQERGMTLIPGDLANPLAVIANYVFDSLPLDAFVVADDELRECPVSLAVPAGIDGRDDPAETIDALEVVYAERPMSGDPYDDPAFNQILGDYRRLLTETPLAFPVGALGVIRRLRDLAGGRLLLLSGDKGYCRERELRECDLPEMAKHGSFSFEVNFHAMGRYFEHLGGRFLSPPHHHGNLCICAGILGSVAPETSRAYAEQIVQGGPDDAYLLMKAVERHYTHFSVPQIIAYLRISQWDGKVFAECFPRLLEQAGKIRPSWQEELVEMVERVWAGYYPLAEAFDLPFAMGQLLHSMMRYDEALVYFQRALDLYGANAVTLHQMALAHIKLGQRTEALNRLERALELDSTFRPARTAYDELLA
jgi:tetratricopeptide (TPR) repeat protein